MDELKFRRETFINPNSKEQAFIKEKSVSKENQQLVGDMLAFDNQLATAMDVKAPDDLAERIKLKQILGQHTTERQWNNNLLAIAASVMLVFALILNFLPATQQLSTLQNNVFAHVMEEHFDLNALQNKNINDANNIINQFGGELTLASASFNYVGNCTVGGTNGVHMVMDGDKGMVTVFLLPNAPQENASEFSDGQFDAQLISTGKGMMAVVGNKGESITRIKTKISSNLKWVI